MPVGAVGRNLGRSGRRAQDIARDRLTQGPENNQDREERGRGGTIEGPEGRPPTLSPSLRALEDKIDEILGGPPRGGEGSGGQIQGPEGREPRRPSPGPPREEEAPALLPGDPNDLGARGRRRRAQDDTTPSPILRRGLLGV